jgi:hypothetical protein
MRRFVALLVIAFAALVGGTAEADIPLTAATPVRTWGATALLSVREGPRFRLATQRGAEPPVPLPGIAPAPHPFEADIGSGPSGSPVIVFARCRGAGTCRLMLTTLAGNQEIAISGSAGVNGFEHAPAVWGNRIAFARRLANGTEQVYVRSLQASKPTRSIRLPAIPRPPCEAVKQSLCGPAVFGPTVVELSMRGSMLAETINLGVIEGELCDRTEVRLVDLANRRGRQVTYSLCGLSGSTLLGASLTATHILWARTCPGDPGGCQSHNTLLYRYSLRNHRVQQAPQQDVLVGFAAEDDDHAVEVSAPEGEGGDCIDALPGTNPPCELARVGPIAFKAGRGRQAGAVSRSAAPARR